MAIYREATLEDGLAIARVWVAAWQRVYAGFMPADYLEALNAELALPAFEAGLRERMSSLVAEVDGSIVGFTAFGSSRDQDAGPLTAELIAINLHPACWRRGFGRALLQETLQRLSERGSEDVTLWVLHGNANARRFYEALGWQHDGMEKRDDKLTGFELHEVRYRKALARPGEP